MKYDPPEYYGYWRYYNANYANTTICLKCETVALYEDAHPACPCKHCGGNVGRYGAARWVPPVYKRKWLFRKELVTEGHWSKPL